MFGGREFIFPGRHLRVLELLPKLQQLELFVDLDGNWSESTLEPLSHLRTLTSLRLSIHNMNGPLLISPALAQLTLLRQLHLCCDVITDADSSNGTSQAHLMQTVSKLTRLQSLSLSNIVESTPAELERLLCLTYLQLSSLELQDPPFAASSSFGLCTELRHISLSHVVNASGGAWQHFCKSLQLLPHLNTLCIMDSDLAAVQPCSWALPLNLTSLILTDCSIRTIPAAVCCLPNLQHLCMKDFLIVEGLASLPKGPYLRNLLSLDINEPNPGAGPEALTDAQCLQDLTILIRQTAKSLWTAAALEQLVPEDCVVSVTPFDD